MIVLILFPIFFETDINGDGIVDGLDFLLWQINSNAFVGLMSPSF